LRSLLLLVCLAPLIGGSASALDRVEEYQRAKKDIQSQLRSKRPDDRIQAIHKLAEFPFEDSVRLIYGSTNDESPLVRDAAIESLRLLSDNQEACDTLLMIARKSAKSRDGGAGGAAALLALLYSDLRSTQRELDEFLGALVDSKAGPGLVVALVDELAVRRHPAAVVPLVRLTKTKAFEKQLGVQRAIVQALVRIPSKEAVGTLIEIMPSVGGEARADAAEYLCQLVEQSFGIDAKAWQSWWEKNQETFRYPARSLEASYRTTISTMASREYYGLPMFAERMVFVLDTSGSMSGLKLEAAKRELINAIQALPPHAHFGVVVFNSTVDAWHRELVAADNKNKYGAIAYVASQVAHSNTASYDALEVAMRFDTEAIYFLSDGAPAGGKITAPVDIVAAVSAANKVRRISIYTIGIDAGLPGGPLDEFLKVLAAQNLGVYRRVDG